MADKTLSMRDELQQLLLVAAGAVPGALLRWQLGAALHDRDVLANVLGALILGLLLGLPCGPRLQLLIGVGFCGAFTTFRQFVQDGHVPPARLKSSDPWKIRKFGQRKSEPLKKIEI